MNINKIRERPKRLFSKTQHLKAVCSPSGAFNSPGLPTPNPEEPLFFNLTTQPKRFIGPEETSRFKILACPHREQIWSELTGNF